MMTKEKIMEAARREIEIALNVCKEHPIDWDSVFMNRCEAHAVWVFAMNLYVDMDREEDYFTIQNRFETEWDKVYNPQWWAILDKLPRH